MCRVLAYVIHLCLFLYLLLVVRGTQTFPRFLKNVAVRIILCYVLSIVYCGVTYGALCTVSINTLTGNTKGIDKGDSVTVSKVLLIICDVTHGL